MSKISDYNVLKYAFDKAESAWTNVASNDGACFTIGLLALPVAALTFVLNADVTPIDFQMDQTEFSITESEVADDFEKLKDVRAEFEALEREHHILSYDDPAAAELLEGELELKAAELDLREKTFSIMLHTNPSVSETEFAHFADQIIEGGYDLGELSVEGPVDAAGLNECRIKHDSDNLEDRAGSINECMKYSDGEYLQSMKTTATFILPLMAMLPGVLLGAFFADSGLPHRRKWRYDSPKLANYKRKPKIGNN